MPGSARIRARHAALAAAILVAALAGAPGARAADFARCASLPEFECATVRVPLDPAGRVPGSVGLRVVRRPDPTGQKIPLVALAGGPGQSAIPGAPTFARSLRPALDRYQLVVLDQRGTGKSDPLSCPELQKQDISESLPSPEAMERCGNFLGDRRAFFGTTETVLDIEALRQELGAPRIALFGISYGTYVATRYASRFPAQVDRLILDSVVPREGPDPFLESSFAAVRRVLAQLCSGGACEGITGDPVADTSALAARIGASPVRGFVYSDEGRRRRASMRATDELFGTLIEGDLNPGLRAAYPAAVASALRGDTAPLLRLKRLTGAGEPFKTDQLSLGLFAASICADTRLPWSPETALDARPALLEQAVAAINPDTLHPFDVAAARIESGPYGCLRWPPTPYAPVPSPPPPLPDVPALIFDGAADLRTPVEDARDVAAALPQAALVTADTGHDVIDADVSGCARGALAAFVADASVNGECSRDGRDPLTAPLAPVVPTSLRATPTFPGRHGRVGRTLNAVLGTVDDTRLSALTVSFTGREDIAGGGLRGGAFEAELQRRGATITLDRIVWIPGVRVSGELKLPRASRELTGKLRVSGSQAAAGRLELERDGSISGKLGGKRVRVGGTRGASLTRSRSLEALLDRLPVRRPLPVP